MLSWRVLAPRSLPTRQHLRGHQRDGRRRPGSVEDGEEGSRKLAARSHGEASAALVCREINQPQQKSHRTNGNHAIDTIIISLPA